jgi:hypothetical protein
MQLQAWVEYTDRYRQAIESRQIKPKPSPEEIISALEAMWRLLYSIAYMRFWPVASGAKLMALAEITGAVIDCVKQRERAEQDNKAKIATIQ